MNLSTSVHQVIAHFIPGFILLLIGALAFEHYYIERVYTDLNQLSSNGFIIAVIISFFLGFVLDAIRTSVVLICWDDCLMKKVDFFLKHEDEIRIKTFEKYYYVYFVFERNICISFVLGFAVQIFILDQFKAKGGLSEINFQFFWIVNMLLPILLVLFCTDSHYLKKSICTFLGISSCTCVQFNRKLEEL